MPSDMQFSLESIQHLTVFKTNPKLLTRLKLNTSQDSFYEAHQLYKTLHFRSITANNFKEAVDLIFNGIVFFYTKKSDNVYYCSDLSKVFIETLKKLPNQVPSLVDIELLNRIRVIHLALMNGSEERNEFACTILKWSGTLFQELFKKKDSIKDKEEQSAITYQKTFGHFQIHRELAHNFWAEENYVQSRYHFLHSTDGTSCAKMLIECHLNYGYPSEAVLFLMQNVLQYLCLRNLKTAREFYDQYLKNHPDMTTPEKYPLCNFLKFLFVSIQHDQVKWFKSLLEVYKPSLDIDPSFGDYLERVGQYFFDLKPKRVEKESIFNNLFKMLSNPADARGSNQAQSSSSNNNDLIDDSEELEDNDLLD